MYVEKCRGVYPGIVRIVPDLVFVRVRHPVNANRPTTEAT